MAISQITLNSTAVVNAANLASVGNVGATRPAPAGSTNKTAVTTALSAPKAFSVELSHAAQARSLELQGYPLSLISLKLGLDLSTVKQYLGITDAARTTYVPPKPAYTEPRKLAEGRSQLAQDLNQLNFAPSEWSRLTSTTNDNVLTSLPSQEAVNVLTNG